MIKYPEVQIDLRVTVRLGRVEPNFYLMDTQWPRWDKKRLCAG